MKYEGIYGKKEKKLKMVIPESTRPALATTGLLSQRKTSQNPFLLLSLSSQNISETQPKPPMSSLTTLFLQVLPPPSVHRPSSGKPPLCLSSTHSPIPPSASMASSNHLHGQPCPWPVVYAALVHGAVPLPLSSINVMKMGKKILPRPSFTSKGVYKYVFLR